MSWIDTFEFDDDFQDFRIDPRGADFWSDRILREVGTGHPLHGRQWDVIAKYCAQDEVVVRHGTDVALVHLTFTTSPPERPPFPDTVFFASAEELRAAFEFR